MGEERNTPQLQPGDRLINRYVGECWVWSYDPASNCVVVGYEGYHFASGEERIFFRGDPYTPDFFGEHWDDSLEEDV